MADRVAIIGGSTVGRDHFPFPAASPAGSLPTLQYPLGFSVQDYCAIFYKVRKWSLGINLEWTNGSGAHSGGISLNWEAMIFPDIGAPYAMTREAEMVLPRSFDLLWSNEEGYGSDVSVFDESFTGDAIDDYSLTLNYLNPFFFDDLLYFDFEMFVNADGDFSCSTYEGNPRDVGRIQFYDTQEVEFYADALTTPDGFGITSIDVQIFPSEYWPYATKAGLPVYDTSTGAQLRDPFS